VTYVDGSISPVLGGPELSLPTLTGTIGQPIDIPVTAKNFIMDPAAISLFIGYDDDVLTYTGHTPGTLTNTLSTTCRGHRSAYNGPTFMV